MKLARTFSALTALVTVIAFMTALPQIQSPGSTPALAQGDPYLAFDMDAENGNGPCDPIDASSLVSAGETYEVAVCLVDAPDAPSAFQINIKYDDSINQCVPAQCSTSECLDSNPDANVGATSWETSLGDGWDCNVMGMAPPICDGDPETGAGRGKAFLACLSLQNLTLPVGPGVVSPLAVATFISTGEGTDTFTMEDTLVTDFQAFEYVSCHRGEGLCNAGAISTESLPPTPTPPVPTPVPTNTPVPGPLATVTAAYVATAIAQGTPAAFFTPAAPGADATAAAASAATSIAQGTPASALTPGGSKTPATTKTAKPSATASADDGEDEDGGGMKVGLIVAIIAGGVVVVGGGGWLAYRRLRG